MVDVSIIIPTYNRKQWLEKAVQSCTRQVGVTTEIIVIDDGGDDETRAMLQDSNAPVEYVWQPNSGPGTARNVGIRMAQGRYIKFLDSDDMLATNALVTECLILDSTNADVSYGKWTYCDEYGEVAEEIYGHCEQDFANGILQGNWYADFAFLFRRESVLSHNLFWDEDAFYIADFSYMLRVAHALSQFVHTPICTGYYRRYPRHEALSKSGKIRREAYIEILRKQQEKERGSNLYRETTFDMRQRLLTAML